MPSKILFFFVKSIISVTFPVNQCLSYLLIFKAGFIVVNEMGCLVLEWGVENREQLPGSQEYSAGNVSRGH